MTFPKRGTTSVRYYYVCLWWTMSFAEGRLHLVTTTSALGGATSSVTIAPAYAVALDDMAVMYPRLFAPDSLTITAMDMGQYPFSCTPDGVGQTINEFTSAYANAALFSAGDHTIILNAVLCPQLYPTIGDFAREDNVLTFSCGARPPARGGRYPTMTTFFPGSNFDNGIALLALMDRFEWRSIALIHDLNLGAILDYAGRIAGQTVGLLAALESRAHDIDSMIIQMDSTKDMKPQIYYRALWKAANHSRIILCDTLHEPLREMMATAFDLRMTDRNEYVFIYVYIFQVPKEKPAEWNDGDDLDLKVKTAFESMLIIRTEAFNWTQLDSLMQRIVRRGNDTYINKTSQYDPEYIKFNEFVLRCYESVELLATLLNETQFSGDYRVNPAHFLNKLKNRTIALRYENFTFGPDGTRAANLVLQRFDTASATFTNLAPFTLKTRNPLGNLTSQQLWPGRPLPSDRPFCGMHGERCQGAPLTSSTIAAATVSIAAAALFGFGIYIRLYHRAIRGQPRKLTIQVKESWAIRKLIGCSGNLTVQPEDLQSVRKVASHTGRLMVSPKDRRLVLEVTGFSGRLTVLLEDRRLVLGVTWYSARLTMCPEDRRSVGKVTGFPGWLMGHPEDLRSQLRSLTGHFEGIPVDRYYTGCQNSTVTGKLSD
ncbi:hypothetical protein BV898_03711 [Hypsibius exemplaris]|uniref:Receptor ligand binding region domain-containing protein n=1 Tax=Hypsibius exemplaris TaxID=2072580 RepID=A0A1W0X3Y4_HYPEX|nr:hypothetical protein BV898_03711 [Hypsibius exemplaris]